MDYTLDFPEPSPRLRGQQIWDVLGKRWLVLTPEERVRQHLILYLHHHLGYPVEAMVSEKRIEVGRTKKRFDLLVYKTSKAFMLCECKAPKVPINQAVLNQAARYNMALNVPVLLLTNGMSHYVLHVKDNKVDWLSEIPKYEPLTTNTLNKSDDV